MSKARSNNVEISARKTNARRKKGVPPRVTHGTRVAFNITCGRCGKDDTLPFVPKNATTILCRDCADEVLGGDWDRGRVERPAEHEFVCAGCGADSVVPFVPEDPDAPLLCKRCITGIEPSNNERVEGGEILNARAGVRKRKA